MKQPKCHKISPILNSNWFISCNFDLIYHDLTTTQYNRPHPTLINVDLIYHDLTTTQYKRPNPTLITLSRNGHFKCLRLSWSPILSWSHMNTSKRIPTKTSPISHNPSSNMPNLTATQLPLAKFDKLNSYSPIYALISLASTELKQLWHYLKRA